jgi:hypothetical protein
MSPGDHGQDSPASENENENETTEPSPGFLGRVDSYNRLMHAHTKNQMQSPGTGTIPTYTKTMHAHTLNQLSEHRRKSKSEASSPRVQSRQVMLPLKVCQELSKLDLDEVTPAPVNTPEQPTHTLPPVIGIDFGKLRRRSLTTPSAARDFAAVEARDFAMAPVG